MHRVIDEDGRERGDWPPDHVRRVEEALASTPLGGTALTDEERQHCREAASDPEWGLCEALLEIIERLTGERFLEGEERE